jgi:hypothetical protein
MQQLEDLLSHDGTAVEKKLVDSVSAAYVRKSMSGILRVKRRMDGSRCLIMAILLHVSMTYVG